MAVPARSTLIPNIERDSDSRGGIVSIVDETAQNVSIITCNPGALRSNHYHLTDWHYMYVLEGAIDYFFKDMDGGDVNYIRVNAGDNVFTPPMEIHATYFPVKTVLIVTSMNPRDQETYEVDTVRVDFVTPENIEEMLAKFA